MMPFVLFQIYQYEMQVVVTSENLERFLKNSSELLEKLKSSGDKENEAEKMSSEIRQVL
jgi:hypothetical protein